MINLIAKPIKTRLTLSAVLVAAFLSGCASKIDTQSEQNAINDFVAQANIASNVAIADETNWWHKLESKQLNALVNSALANNYNLQTSQLTLKSTLARLGEQKAQYLPQGGVNIGAARSDAPSVFDRQSSANIALDWQLDLFGRITALVDAANASAMSQAEQVRSLQIEVVSSVVKGYVSYQGNVEKQHIIAMQINALEQSIEVLQARVDEGVANELDLNRTMAQLRQQEALMPAIEYAKYSDLSTLAVLTGKLAQDIAIDNEQNLLEQSFSVALKNANSAIALRPDISRALYDFSQANSLSVAASKALLPDISLSAFAGVVSIDSTGLKNTDQQWQVAPQLQWSILSYPALLAQRDAQQFLSEAAYSDYQQIVLNAVTQSELSLQMLVNQQQQERYAKQRYGFANKAFLQAQAMYEEGQIPYLELLDARQDVLMAQENAVDTTIATLLAKVNAYQAFNGQWSYALSSTK
ncbi:MULTISPECIES: TolC family protein [unclassified Pseudoalteromonas]|uniref:TolC family protein n=1 Tax=unclassified Pseudoalteromonas TaxID=194690 RepID=UPI002358423E|nr:MULTISPECIES: TolC family protein [unclassified Pseudoalteromonas]MDC9564756.1 TolC family protein [Pseudoalteromonas sp. GAB2316C]MDC9568476.1 TolC family protein [Pseudoalteromonas sp. GABNB9D]MDC9572732.1 TolC family protein [Pseudoalteromonas sp. GABNS16A]MDC9576967.1 TolC family protein [Pseudoalteromonas sp. GABNS16E]MDC9584377.1 TolC family protein [Pseudoalteromonas sp. GABNS16C]|tara:strand:- start:3656 stop:5065 length:1410 start_codon:yes stop_codon:yes gene_type:complete